MVQLAQHPAEKSFLISYSKAGICLSLFLSIFPSSTTQSIIVIICVIIRPVATGLDFLKATDLLFLLG